MYFDMRLWLMTQGRRGAMAACVALGLLAIGCGLARFVFLGQLLALVLRGAPAGQLAGAAAGIAVAVVLRALCEHARTELANRTAAGVQQALRLRLFDKLVALGPGWFGAERTGGVMLSVVDGVEQLQSFFGQYLPQLAIAAAAPLLIFAVIAWWDLPVATILLAAALLTLTLPILVHRWDRRAALARQTSFRAFAAFFLDAVQGLPTLKAFGQSAAYGEKLAARARALSQNTFWVLALGLLTRGITDLGTALGAALAIAVGAWRVRHGAMSLEALLIVLMAGTEIFRPLRDLRGVLHQGMIGQSAAVGIHALLEAESDAPVAGTAASAVPAPILSPAVPAPTAVSAVPAPTAVSAVPAPTAVSAAPAPTIAPAVPAPTIAFESVAFAYPGGRGPAHRGLSFTVGAGERVAIVGPSGAGKSSVVRLLLRLHDPQGGRVLLGGRDLRTLDPADIRRHIAVVAQDASLFHGTVAENLRLGRPEASQAEIEAAARDAYAHDFIMALPQGYDTLLGERALRLSGGQRQRLAIARALLRDAPILVLDEALSAVDARSEALIQHALDRLMQGRTTLILAHRLSSVIGADRILVLDDGRVIQSGPHAELIRQDGPYRRLMAPQMESSPVVGALAPEAAAAATPADEAGAPEERPVAELGWGATLGTLAGFVRPFRVRLGLTIACGIGRVLAFIGVSVAGALVIAAVRQPGGPGNWLIAALLLLAPVAALLHWLESWAAHDMAYRLLAEMRIALFRQLDALAPAYLLRRRAGDLVALATQDVETVEYFFAHTIAPAIVALLVPVAVLAGLAWVNPWLAAVLLPFLLYGGLAPVLGRRRIDALGGQARAALGLVGAHVTETIQGMADLLAFTATAQRRAVFEAELERYGRMRGALLRDQSRQAAALEAATALGGLAVALAGAALVGRGVLPAGLLPLLVLISVAAFLPVAEIAQVGRQLADTIAATRRLHAVAAEPVAIADGRLSPPPGGGMLQFAHVGFGYPGGAAVLHDIDAEIPAGATVALVGPSGAGKTTLAQLLLRFWDPQQGAIRLDGIDLRDLRLDALRASIALVAQDSFLFDDTLEANIRLARPQATAEEVAQALRHAALEDFVARLPQGLATRVGARGMQLSGGQRQRVAIARAFLKDAPVLILDEATSHLDTISEAQVRTALDRLMVQRTTLVIAHRLSTIQAADLILVLDRGRIAERGRHGELLQRGGLYARLLAHQADAAGGAAERWKKAV